MSMFKVTKEHTPISVYNMFNLSQRNNILVLVNLPSIHLKISQNNFVNQCSLFWNRFIRKVLEKCTPENSGVLILIQGFTKNSELCTPIPFVKNKLRNMLLDFQRGGDPNLWDPSNFCKY